MLHQIRRMQRGIEMDEDQLAVEEGQFLTLPHTLRHLRTTQWRQKPICRQGYEQWSAQGRTSIWTVRMPASVKFWQTTSPGHGGGRSAGHPRRGRRLLSRLALLDNDNHRR
ncbi:MAG TPA: hypothetical protein VLT88_06105 [Desulfosarcina sp.]|nr:hypothetical protein [Desulfosarcina sp.]